LKPIKKTVENHMEKGIIKVGKMKIACNKCFLNKSKDGTRTLLDEKD
jgi:hypothetical protein